MRTVRDACVLQPGALSINVSDKVAQLDELIADEGDGFAFFERTFITNGMQTLMSEGITRLAGASSQSVFHLKQAMGGGKTHLLIGIGLLAKYPNLRRKYCTGMSHADEFSSAIVAAFNGRNRPNHFFWGEIANQLGKGDQFSQFWTSGPQAPDERDWLNLFAGDQPILILLDEMPPYLNYYDTQKVGNGTIADIATCAFANLLTAAGKKKNVCVVVSDLAAAYATGGRLINAALEDARAELGRMERTITPVDLAANEIYEILRKQLFASLPDSTEIGNIAAAYGKKLEEAAKAKTAGRGAEAIADEIAATYPFHPRLKNIVALFKENEQFKQTRGLIELVSRLLQSVWSQPANDVFLIGPQHFDLSIPDVRDKIVSISGMQDVIAKDLWDAQQSAHAQTIDLNMGTGAAGQVGTLLLTASLSTAVNAVKGLTREEIVESLVSPLNEASEYLAAFDELEKLAWYLHHTTEGRFYFDRTENLTKLLQNLARDAPQPQVEELIRKRLEEMFKPGRKTCYGEVLPLPKLEDAAERVRKGRVLLITNPDDQSLEDVQRFFEGLAQKNNLCVLTGSATRMASVEKAARQHYAAQKADKRVPANHPQREDLEAKQQTYEQDFNATILALFETVLFPIQRAGQPARLADKHLEKTRDAKAPFDGEEQIEKTLTSDPLKLYLDVKEKFDAIRDKAEDLLFLENQDDARWSDIVDRYAEMPGMYWLPPKGLEDLRTLACDRGLWEDLGNGQITKRPKKKKTSVQVVAETEPDDEGKVRLRVNALNAGPTPKIYFAAEGPVSEQSPRLTDQTLETSALFVNFMAVDPSNQFETGDPVGWMNKLVLRVKLTESGDQRRVEILVAPRGTIRYTLDGSEPREGTPYTGPIPIGNGAVLLQAFAEAGRLEAKRVFPFPAKEEGPVGPLIDDAKPGSLVKQKGVYKLDSREKTFRGLSEAAKLGASFQNLSLTVGQGSTMIQVAVGEIAVDAAFVEGLLTTLLERVPPNSPVNMNFKRAQFPTGFDLKEFAKALGITLEQGDIEQ